jgi:hypothetical protein
MTTDPIGRARAAAERGAFEAAIAILQPLSDAGNPEAQFHLGCLALTECELISGREAFSLFMAPLSRVTLMRCVRSRSFRSS